MKVLMKLSLIVCLIFLAGCLAVPKGGILIYEKYATNADGSPLIITDPDTGQNIGFAEVLKSRKVYVSGKFLNENTTFEANRTKDYDKVKFSRTIDASPGVEARYYDNQRFQNTEFTRDFSAAHNRN